MKEEKIEKLNKKCEIHFPVSSLKVTTLRMNVQ